jgi:hypothetical protein
MGSVEIIGTEMKAMDAQGEDKYRSGYLEKHGLLTQRSME